MLNETNSISTDGFIDAGIPITSVLDQIASYNDLCGMEMIDSEAQVGIILAFLVEKIGTWLPSFNYAFDNQDSWAHTGTVELFDRHRIIIQDELLYSLYLFMHKHVTFSLDNLTTTKALSWKCTQITVVGCLCIVRIKYKITREYYNAK